MPGLPCARFADLLTATTIAFGIAAFMLLVRYVLLLVNRGMLLNPWLADGVIWLGIVAAVVAFFLLLALAIVLSNWLIARRAAAFAHRGQTDPRPAWALRWGCLVPFVNLVWAPVFVYELARVESRVSLMRRPLAGVDDPVDRYARSCPSSRSRRVFPTPRRASPTTRSPRRSPTCCPWRFCC